MTSKLPPHCWHEWHLYPYDSKPCCPSCGRNSQIVMPTSSDRNPDTMNDPSMD